MGNQTSTMNQNNMGTLNLIIGCMYAGKTTRLIDTYNDALDNDENVIILTHSSENRYSIDEISTHDRKKISCVKYTSITSFMDNEKNAIESSDVILIDEGQFFDDLLQVLTFVEVNKKKVHVFGLDGDFKRNIFGKILELIPLCDSVEKITAECKCGEKALFSNRTINNESQVLVGSNDVYEPLCRKCYVSSLNNK
jgi:thymidine kinase